MSKAYWIGARMTVKDMDTAIACHEPTIYQNALKKPDGSVDRNLFVIEGIE